MSVRVMADVFAHSKAKGTDRLVLLAIADSANDHGCEAWPSLATIAQKAGIDRRTVSRCVGRLVDLGELERVRKGGLSGRGGVSNSYRVTVSKQGQDAPSDISPLGAERPEVGATRPSSGGDSPHYPSRTIQNQPRPPLRPVENPVGFPGPTDAGRAAAANAKRALGTQREATGGAT